MDIPTGLIEARDNMQAARLDLANHLERLTDAIELIPDSEARTAMIGVAEAVCRWGKSMGTAVEGVNELIRRGEGTSPTLFPPGMDTLTEPQRRTS